MKGIGAHRVKSFLSVSGLVNGSEHGEGLDRWGEPHEFWEGTIASTGYKAIFFSGDSIDALVVLLAEQVDQVPMHKLEPGTDACYIRNLRGEKLMQYNIVQIQDELFARAQSSIRARSKPSGRPPSNNCQILSRASRAIASTWSWRRPVTAGSLSWLSAARQWP